MEFLIAIGTSIAGKIAEYTVTPLGRRLGYIIHCRRNVDNLKTETQDLDLQKKKMEVLVDEANRRGDEIHDDIKVWLSKVGKITEDTEKLLGDDNTTEMMCTFKGSFSYLASQYQLSKKAKKMGESVVKIKGKISFDNISFRPKLQSSFENKDYLNFATREKFVDEIMEVLGDANVRKIGLHGMPGVGKTTIVKEIARKALANDHWRLFDNAVIVTVSQTPNFETIQQQIAERLGLELKKKIISERALELKNRLNKEKKFLIVLDDLWNELKLEDVGIVFESGQKGCKILITSRFEGLLGINMEVDKNFKVELLSEDEALSWFSVIVGDAYKTREFQELGTKIVKKCGCLPLAIITVAHSLKKQELPIWRDAWTRLENSEQNEVVSSAIKLCYNFLESDETKKLVSLCSLHEEDANIQTEYLMRNCWGMGMFKGNMTLQNARDRVYGWVNTLKDRCLLLDGDYSGAVKMHDVVRDITISIAKESHNMHCFRDGGEVEEFLNQKKFEDLKAISLPNGYLDELVLEQSEYTQLQFMICLWRKSSKIIPGNLLDRTKLLRVLEFSGQEFDLPKVLASHLSPLQNLRTLRLRNSDVGDIAEIGKLKNLEILDLFGSKIKKLPSEIGQLTRLRMLDLSICSGLQVIEPNAIQHLKRLEELYVDDFKNWHKVDQVDNGERRNAGLDELNHLVCLTALHLYVPDVEMLREVLLGQKLERYEIKIGVDNYGFSQNSVSRHLQIKHTESSLLREHGLEVLMRRSEVLWLEGLNDVNNIVRELDTEGFPELKSLGLGNNNTIQYLVDSMGQIHPCMVFGSLETLFLKDLSNLKQICHGEDTVELFKTLRVVEVRNCNSLKKLLPLFNARQLEEIEISNCNVMEEIFTHGIQDDDDDNKEAIEELLRLRSLKLEDVSILREFCSKISLKTIGLSQKEEEPLVGDSVMPLFNGKFLCFPKLENLELCGCHVKKIWDDQLRPSSTSFCCLTKLVVVKCKFLKCVVSSSMAASFKQLYTLEVKDCEAMEEIVSRDERMEKMSFPKLYSMKLEELPRLSRFSSGILIEFPMLNHLRIMDCFKLKTFVSESTEDKSNTTMPFLFNENFVCFPKLENLELLGCDFKKIWDDELLPTSTSFRCLSSLEVADCMFLKYVFSSAMAVCFEQLNSVEVRDCETMEEIMSRSDERVDNISFPKLQSLVLKNHLYMVSFSSEISIEFPMLTEFSIDHCPEWKTFFSKSSAGSSLFDERVAFPSLKIVNIFNMDGLKMIWNCELGTNTDSFCKLEEVQIGRCKNLVKIFPSGMHTRLHNLTKLQIGECEMVEDIFEIQTSNSVEIIPTQLNTLKLHHLPNLKYVWSKDPRGLSQLSDHKEKGLETLLPHHDYHFVFPQLEEIDLRSLPKFVSFYAGSQTSTFPLLKRLTVNDCREVKVLFSSETFNFQRTHGDIPIQQQPLFFITTDKVAFPSLKRVCIHGMDGLKMIWQYELCANNADSFCKLEEVKIEYCKNLMGICPSGMYRRLGNLKGLIIYNCEMVEEIFELETSNSVEVHDIISTQLKYLELYRLSNLKYVWSKDPQGTFMFPKLEEVRASYCPNLKAIFPHSVAKGLSQLSELFIKECGIEEIVGKQEVLETVPPDHQFVFPQLQKIYLRSLPNLVSFYERPHISRFPLLSFIEVKDCLKVKVCFASELLRFQSKHGSAHDDIPIQQPLFFTNNVAFPSLKSVYIHGMDGLKMIWQNELCSNADSFCKLEDLKVEYCENLTGIFPSGMHTRMGNLRRLEISNCEMVEEIFQMETSNSEETHDIISTQLKYVGLNEFSNLKYVCTKDPQGTFTCCPNLISVYAYGCPNLKAIFPPSVAKHLSQLINLSIHHCGIEEVVGNKQEGLETVLPPDHDDDEFVFPQLQNMELESLPNLVSFYAGTHTLRFPLLKRLQVIDCLKVKAFSGSELLSYQGRHGSLFSTKVTFGRDLECEVKLCELPNLMHLMEEKEESSQQPQTLVFPDKTYLEVVRCEGLKNLVPSSISFQNLDILIVTGCHGMLHLLSSQTVKSMAQLRGLKVAKCKIMEQIISDAVVDSKGCEIVFTRLQHLVLDDLPRLASFYSENYTMRFPNLEVLDVIGCYEMQSFSKHCIVSTPKLKQIIIDHIDYGESKSELESKSKSETISSSNRMVDINCIIAKHWMSPGTALQELFTENDLAPSNVSAE